MKIFGALALVSFSLALPASAYSVLWRTISPHGSAAIAWSNRDQAAGIQSNSGNIEPLNENAVEDRVVVLRSGREAAVLPDIHVWEIPRSPGVSSSRQSLAATWSGDDRFLLILHGGEKRYPLATLVDLSDGESLNAGAAWPIQISRYLQKSRIPGFLKAARYSDLSFQSAYFFVPQSLCVTAETARGPLIDLYFKLNGKNLDLQRIEAAPDARQPIGELVLLNRNLERLFIIDRALINPFEQVSLLQDQQYFLSSIAQIGIVQLRNSMIQKRTVELELLESRLVRERAQAKVYPTL